MDLLNKETIYTLKIIPRVDTVLVATLIANIEDVTALPKAVN
jgi:hypothetical protein